MCKYLFSEIGDINHRILSESNVQLCIFVTMGKQNEVLTQLLPQFFILYWTLTGNYSRVVIYLSSVSGNVRWSFLLSCQYFRFFKRCAVFKVLLKLILLLEEMLGKNSTMYNIIMTWWLSKWLFKWLSARQIIEYTFDFVFTCKSSSISSLKCLFQVLERATAVFSRQC